MLFAAFNVQHWIFGFKYYKLAEVMEFLYAGKKVPEQVMKRHKCMNITFIILNFMVSLMAGGIYYAWMLFIRAGEDFNTLPFSKTYTCGKILVGLLDIISGGFLIYGILSI